MASKSLVHIWAGPLLAVAVHADTGIRFEERSQPAGVLFRHESSKSAQKYLIEAMGAGVAVFDFDADGRLDLYFVNGADLSNAPGEMDKSDPRHWNRLYRNRGGWRFEDVTEEAQVAGRGYGMGVAVADYDGDGDQDLYVSNFGPDILYENQGDGRFRDATAEAGISAGGWSSGAAFLDFDKDGLLDLFVAQYLDWSFATSRPCGDRLPHRRSYCHPREFAPVRPRLHRNLGGGRFREVSARVGLDEFPGKGLGVALNDFDNDGWVDIFLANDSYPQQLFLNVRGRRFDEAAVQSGTAFDREGRDFAGMGVVAEDYDGDLQPDILVNALGRQGYWLYRNVSGYFETQAGRSGVAALSELRSGWGMGLVDFDNDGWRDLLVAQGHVMDDIAESDPALAHEEPLLLARNLFGRFYDVASQSGAAIRTPVAGRGMAFGDLDGDGGVDAVVSVNDGSALLLRNVSARGESVEVRLVGAGPNRDAIGAVVRVRSSGSREQLAFRSNAGSYLSASSPALHFGLGVNGRCQAIEVTWPNGSRQTILEPDVGVVVITQREGPVRPVR